VSVKRCSGPEHTVVLGPSSRYSLLERGILPPSSCVSQQLNRFPRSLYPFLSFPTIKGSIPIPCRAKWKNSFAGSDHARIVKTPPNKTRQPSVHTQPVP
jgi:hypothetical protein